MYIILKDVREPSRSVPHKRKRNHYNVIRMCFVSSRVL